MMHAQLAQSPFSRSDVDRINQDAAREAWSKFEEHFRNKYPDDTQSRWIAMALYDFKFEFVDENGNRCFPEKNAIDRYLTYFENASAEQDPDKTLLATGLVVKLLERIPEIDVSVVYVEKGAGNRGSREDSFVCKIGDSKEIAFERDTLNSAWTRLKNLLKLECSPKCAACPHLPNNLRNRLAEYTTDSKCSEEELVDRKETLDRYLHLTHTIGNFGVIPLGRGSGGNGDFIDPKLQRDPKQSEDGEYIKEWDKVFRPAMLYGYRPENKDYIDQLGSWLNDAIPFGELETPGAEVLRNESEALRRINQISASILMRGIAIARLLSP